jgi:hypothetical protein
MKTLFAIIGLTTDSKEIPVFSTFDHGLAQNLHELLNAEGRPTPPMTFLLKGQTHNLAVHAHELLRPKVAYYTLQPFTMYAGELP